MQYYTKQQLQGAGGYSPGVRVGNWNEEVNLQETKLKELLLKQQEGSLKLNKCVMLLASALLQRRPAAENKLLYPRFQQRMAVALQPVQCTTIRNDGLVHFGDVLQLVNASTSAVLACDIEDRVSPHAVPLLVTALPTETYTTIASRTAWHFMAQSSLQDTRIGDFSCAVSACANTGSVSCNTCLIAKYSPAHPTIVDRDYTGKCLKKHA